MCEKFFKMCRGEVNDLIKRSYVLHEMYSDVNIVIYNITIPH